MAISIQHVTRANVSVLSNIADDVFDDPILPERLDAYLADPRHALFVAVENGLVVGHIRGCVHLQPDRASDLYVDNLGTSPSYQRRGAAREMMRSLLAWGETQGCTYAWVATETDNHGAIGFYGAQEFTQATIAMFALEMD